MSNIGIVSDVLPHGSVCSKERGPNTKCISYVFAVGGSYRGKITQYHGKRLAGISQCNQRPDSGCTQTHISSHQGVSKTVWDNGASVCNFSGD